MAGFADLPDPHDTRSPSTGEPGRLFLWLPVGLALRKVRRYLRQVDHLFATTDTGALIVESPEGYPGELLLDLAELLTGDEGADTRCVFKRGDGELNVEDIRRVRTIHELRHLERSSWLIDMLRGDRLTSVFQPIVHARETSRVLGHEALLRGIGFDGKTVSPGPMFDAARGCGMLPELDYAAS
ncbi:MAG TPA: EAL domain-containing protein, partial [Gemmatimonadaceae bacterium]|nr:EAL domain-containing protein [Gemmatimonadaceae bacterium]